MSLLQAADHLVRELRPLRFAPPITHVYNPLDYARAAYRQYVERHARPGCAALLLGMNPGPFGMAQTGVPFGEVSLARDWLGIHARVGRPEREHPRRPVLGFDCPRSEVSGARLWGWAREAFGSPERFFRVFFVGNYCPLVFMEDSGRNRTPDKLGAEERAPLYEACDRHLRGMVEALRPKYVVGVGKFAEGRAREALAGADVMVGGILHPSPASPQANRDWSGQAEAQLRGIGVEWD